MKSCKRKGKRITAWLLIAVIMCSAIQITAVPKAARAETAGTVDLTQGLKGYWTFDGDGANMWKNEIDPSLYPIETKGNGLSQGTGVASGGAATFDGTSYLAIPLKLNNSSAKFSFSFWAKYDSDMFKKEDSAIILQQSGKGRTMLMLKWETDPSKKLYGTYMTAVNSWFRSEPDWTSWHHVVVSSDPDAKTMSLYLNGILVSTNTLSDNYVNEATDLIIGAHKDGTSGNKLKGSFDQLRYYDRVITAEEVNAIAAEEAPEIMIENAKKGLRMAVAEAKDLLGQVSFESAVFTQLSTLLLEAENMLGSDAGSAEEIIAMATGLRAAAALLSQFEKARADLQAVILKAKDSLAAAAPGSVEFIALESLNAQAEALHINANTNAEALKEMLEALHAAIAALSSITAVAVTVYPDQELKALPKEMFGINHRYHFDGVSSWDADANRPFEEFDLIARQSSYGSVRYPGGAVANLFEWKRSIGPKEQRIGTIHGAANYSEQEAIIPNFGLDEAASYINDDLNSEMVYVYGMGRGSASDAADLVEYLNAPNDGSNPGGGTDWAARRADNGHPEPYGITYFEMGNELDIWGQDYWLSGRASGRELPDAYLNGGAMSFTDQPLVNESDWRKAASKGDGTPGQVKYTKYFPVSSDAVVKVGGAAWTKTTDLAGAGSSNVYTLDEATGRISFGDGTNGNIPAAGSALTISYTSMQDGLKDYYREMKAIDPTVRIYSCIEGDLILAADDAYDGLVIHPYAAPADTPQFYEEAIKLVKTNPVKRVQDLEKKISAAKGENSGIDIVVSEFGLFRSSNNLLKTQTNAVVTAYEILQIAYLNVAYSSRHCLIDYPDGDVLGPGQQAIIQAISRGDGTYDYVATPSTKLYELLGGMTGTKLVEGKIEGNAEFYQGIDAIYSFPTKDEEASYVTLLNLFKDTAKPVRISFDGMDLTNKVIEVWTLDGDRFDSENTVDAPDEVTVKKSIVTAATPTLSYTLSPHSVTAFKVIGAGVDYQVLLAKIDEANTYNPDEYSAESYEALLDALAYAAQLNEQSEQHLLTEAIMKIDRAIKGLVKLNESDELVKVQAEDIRIERNPEIGQDPLEAFVVDQSASCDGGAQLRTNKIGATMKIQFEGNGFAFYTKKGSSTGIVTIAIDGTEYEADTYSSSPQFKVPAFSKQDLPYGNHEVVITTTDRNLHEIQLLNFNFDYFELVNRKVPTNNNVQTEYWDKQIRDDSMSAQEASDTWHYQILSGKSWSDASAEAWNQDGQMWLGQGDGTTEDSRYGRAKIGRSQLSANFGTNPYDGAAYGYRAPKTGYVRLSFASDMQLNPGSALTLAVTRGTAETDQEVLLSGQYSQTIPSGSLSVIMPVTTGGYIRIAALRSENELREVEPVMEYVDIAVYANYYYNKWKDFGIGVKYTEQSYSQFKEAILGVYQAMNSPEATEAVIEAAIARAEEARNALKLEENNSGGSGSPGASGPSEATPPPSQDSSKEVTVLPAVQNTTVSDHAAQMDVLLTTEMMGGQAFGNVTIQLPSKQMLEQLAKDAVTSLSLGITIPGSNADYKKLNALILSKEVLSAARTGKKDIRIAVKNTDGTELYAWNFDGRLYPDKMEILADINLAMNSREFKQLEDKNRVKELLKNTPELQNGISISFRHSGTLPATAGVKLPVISGSAVKPGDTLYLYYYNEKTKKLDELPNNNYMVAKDGTVTMNIVHCSDYVLLPARPDKALVTDLLSQILVSPSSKTLYAGGSAQNTLRIKRTLPSTLIQGSGSGNASLDKGKAEVGITYKSSNSKVATVSKAGLITAKGSGEAVVSVTLSIYGGKKKIKKVIVTVKTDKPKITASKTRMKLNSKFRFRGEASGFQASEIAWSSDKPSVVAVTRQGTASARKKGSAILTVTAGKNKRTIKVTVI